MTRLSRFEQETNINFNAGEKIATVYTRDRAVMRKLDALVTEFPDIYRCVSESDMEKCYELPKSHVSYRKPRKITEAKREQAREAMKKINIKKQIE